MIDKSMNERARAFIDGHVTTLPLPVQLHGITEAEKASAAELCADFATQETLALTAERDELKRKNAVLRATLQACRDKWDTAGNGRCGVCRSGYRMSDLKGNVQRCENPACLSHQIRTAIEECK